MIMQMKKSTWLCGFIFLGAGITVSLAGAEIHGWVKDIYNRPLVGRRF